MGNLNVAYYCGQTKYTLEQGFECFALQPELLALKQQKDGIEVNVNGNESMKGRLYKVANSLNNRYQLDQYLFRHHNIQYQLPLVKVHGVKQFEKINFLQVQKYYFVITENLITLNQIQNCFTFEQCTYALFQSLLGFYYFYCKFAIFQITEKMIAVNTEGKIKIWINENFANNHPKNENPTLFSTNQHPYHSQHINYKSQQFIINEIFKIINEKYAPNFIEVTYQKRIETYLMKYLSNKDITKNGIKNLLHALSQFQQQYSSKYFIPNWIILQKQKSKRPLSRQSFSLRLHRTIQQYQNSNIYIQQQQILKQTQNSHYLIGIDGKTTQSQPPKKSASHVKYINHYSVPHNPNSLRVKFEDKIENLPPLYSLSPNEYTHLDNRMDTLHSKDNHLKQTQFTAKNVHYKSDNYDSHKSVYNYQASISKTYTRQDNDMTSENRSHRFNTIQQGLDSKHIKKHGIQLISQKHHPIQVISSNQMNNLQIPKQYSPEALNYRAVNTMSLPSYQSYCGKENQKQFMKDRSELLWNKRQEGQKYRGWHYLQMKPKVQGFIGENYFY